MGWFYLHDTGGKTVFEYFRDQVAYDNEKVSRRLLSGRTVAMKTFYGAVEVIDKATNERTVSAMVCLVDLRKSKDGYNFGYKDMDEFMGPCASDCPADILALLTPLTIDEDGDRRDSLTAAREWRARCEQNLQRRKLAKSLKHGTVIALSTPLRFTDGVERAKFRVIKVPGCGKRKGKVYFQAIEDGVTVKISNWRSREFTVVPPSAPKQQTSAHGDERPTTPSSAGPQ